MILRFTWLNENIILIILFGLCQKILLNPAHWTFKCLNCSCFFHPTHTADLICCFLQLIWAMMVHTHQVVDMLFKAFDQVVKKVSCDLDFFWPALVNSEFSSGFLWWHPQIVMVSCQPLLEIYSHSWSLEGLLIRVCWLFLTLRLRLEETGFWGCAF